MTVRSSIDPAPLLEEQLAQASPDLLRELLGSFIQTLLSAEADAVCGAEYGTSSLERVNRRNGYRRTEGLPGDQLAAVPQGIPFWRCRMGRLGIRERRPVSSYAVRLAGQQ